MMWRLYGEPMNKPDNKDNYRPFLTGASVWTGDQMASQPSWRFSFTGEILADVDAALTEFMANDGQWQDATVEAFPLNSFTPLAQKMAHELENGSGLALLQGFPVDKYSEDQRRAIWFAIGQHMGTPVYQDFKGQMMRDIRDEQQDTDEINGHHLATRDGSAFQSSKARTLANGALRFHTDRTDVVALFCIGQAKKGGISKIAASPSLYNHILERRPDLHAVLCEPYFRARLGEEKGGENDYYALPVFGLKDGFFTSHYSRTYIEAADEMPQLPSITPVQWEALDYLNQVAEEICFEMTFAPGDMQFINNHIIYHARTAFEDEAAGTAKSRCLHRLWLSMANSRPLPDDHKILWQQIEAGALRGGIMQP
jgi:hypothetical protein